MQFFISVLQIIFFLTAIYSFYRVFIAVNISIETSSTEFNYIVTKTKFRIFNHGQLNTYMRRVQMLVKEHEVTFNPTDLALKNNESFEDCIARQDKIIKHEKQEWDKKRYTKLYNIKLDSDEKIIEQGKYVDYIAYGRLPNPSYYNPLIVLTNRGCYVYLGQERSYNKYFAWFVNRYKKIYFLFIFYYLKGSINNMLHNFNSDFEDDIQNIQNFTLTHNRQIIKISKNVKMVVEAIHRDTLKAQYFLIALMPYINHPEYSIRFQVSDNNFAVSSDLYFKEDDVNKIAKDLSKDLSNDYKNFKFIISVIGKDSKEYIYPSKI